VSNVSLNQFGGIEMIRYDRKRSRFGEELRPAVILVDADFLGDQFRMYQDFFFNADDPFDKRNIREEGIPEKLDPCHLKRALLTQAQALEEESNLVLFTKNGGLDYFDSEPSHEFRVVSCTGQIRDEMLVATESDSKFRHLLCLGGVEYDDFNHGWWQCYDFLSFITSYEEEEYLAIEGERLLAEYADSREDCDIYYQGLVNRVGDVWNDVKSWSEIAWVMGFTRDHSMYVPWEFHP
jgi:hypothetical protein